MSELNPLELFGLSVVLSAATAFGALLDRTDEPLTLRKISGTMLFHGMVGGAVAMIAYEYFLWKNKTGQAWVAAILYGGGLISFKWLKKVLQSNVRSIGLGDPDEPRKP